MKLLFVAGAGFVLGVCAGLIYMMFDLLRTFYDGD